VRLSDNLSRRAGYLQAVNRARTVRCDSDVLAVPLDLTVRNIFLQRNVRKAFASAREFPQFPVIYKEIPLVIIAAEKRLSNA
jgi:hypothetical protein